MLEGLRQLPVGNTALPFVRLFYGRQSRYLWEFDEGEIHYIPQGEGGEQGDAMMPLLYSLGQHRALQAVAEQPQEGEHLFAFLYDTIFVSSPLRVGPVYATLQESLNVHAGIQINAGKTQIWNKAGVRPEVCNVLERVARISNPRSIVWRGSQLPLELQGIKILGTPLGHPEFVARHLQGVLEEQRVFLNRIPLVSDIQSAWLLLLHCANARANYQIRAVTPEGVEAYARAHDDGIWQCFCELLELDPTAGDNRREIANLPLLLGGLGLRSASRLRESAHWASWADCLEMIHQRHPDVANRLVAQLEGHPDTPCLRAATTAAWSITGVMGFEPPSWTALAGGVRPAQHQPEDFEPGATGGGWQHEAACRIEQRARDTLLLSLPDSGKALVRSQGGPGAGLAFTTCPTCRITKMEPAVFTSLFPGPSTAADVASHSILVATIVQPVPRLGFWGGVMP